MAPVGRQHPAGGARPDAPLYQRVEQQVPKLARQMVARFLEEVPFYARLPREQVEGEILAITEGNLTIFFRSLREGRGPTDEELAEFRLSAARRAEERVPLDSVLQAYYVGSRLGWEALVAAARPDEQDALIAAAGRVLGYAQAVTASVAAAYLEEQQLIIGEERDASRELAVALLSGEPADALAGRIGVELSSAYFVLAMRIGPHADERNAGVAAAVAGRRKLRRVQDRMRQFTGQPALGLLDATGGLALVPQPDTDDSTDALRAAVRSMAAAAGADLHVAVTSCPDRRDLPAAAERAREVLRLVLLLDRPPGLYELRDVLLEYQLSRSTDALPLLQSLLDPLERNPDLSRTLESYLDHDLDRRATAAALHVHPNTLDYRLKRVIELTGLDLSSTSGLQLLGAAVAARRTAD